MKDKPHVVFIFHNNVEVLFCTNPKYCLLLELRDKDLPLVWPPSCCFYTLFPLHLYLRRRQTNDSRLDREDHRLGYATAAGDSDVTASGDVRSVNRKRELR